MGSPLVQKGLFYSEDIHLLRYLLMATCTGDWLPTLLGMLAQLDVYPVESGKCIKIMARDKEREKENSDQTPEWEEGEKKRISVTLIVAWVLAPEGWFVFGWQDSNPMWSSAIVAHLPQGLTHCSRWGTFLLTTVGKSAYLSSSPFSSTRHFCLQTSCFVAPFYINCCTWKSQQIITHFWKKTLKTANLAQILYLAWARPS